MGEDQGDEQDDGEEGDDHQHHVGCRVFSGGCDRTTNTVTDEAASWLMSVTLIQAGVVPTDSVRWLSFSPGEHRIQVEAVLLRAEEIT